MTADLQPSSQQRLPEWAAAPAAVEAARSAAVAVVGESKVEAAGGPTEHAFDDRRAPGWRAAAIASARLLVDRPALIAVGLLGFLARGGLVVFLLPIVTLPTPTGISNFIGGNALTGAGATEGLIALIAAGILLVTAAAAIGAVAGACADIILAREAMDAGAALAHGVVTEHGRAAIRHEARAAMRITPGLVGQVLAVRAITLLPVGAAAVWAATRLVAAGYHQLILPDDVALPLAVRIFLEALDAALTVLVVWLIAELVGGIAVRHVLVGRRSAPVAIGLAVVTIVRRPVTSLATAVIGVVGVVVAVGPALVVASMLWSRLQALLADDVAIPLLLPATFVFVLIWVGGLGAVGIVAAWRSLLGTLDVDRARRPASAPMARAVLDSLATAPSGPEVALQEG